jgi:general stress protein 26
METNAASTEKKLDELYELIEDMELALMTTRRPDGSLVTRPMATQRQEPIGDLWFVTNIDMHKIDEIEMDPNVCLGYYDKSSKEWVSVSGTATVSQDRSKIRELHKPDWRFYFEDEGGDRDGGLDDPRLALICVDAHSVHYLKAKYSKPRALFEVARKAITGKPVDMGREEILSRHEIS